MTLATSTRTTIRRRFGHCSSITSRRRPLSISERIDADSDFAQWLTGEFANRGAFTALVVLVEIREAQIAPLCSTYFNVIGDEVEWSDIAVMFAGAGRQWDGAAFFSLVGPSGGPLDNPAARVRLRELEFRIDNDRLVLTEGQVFDKRGQRMTIEETASG